MKRLLLLLLLLAAVPALAMDAETASKLAQASMLVTGTIMVRPDGAVADYSIEHPEALPPAVLKLVQDQVPQWQFVVPAGMLSADQVLKQGMNLRVVATPAGQHEYHIAIVGAVFQALADPQKKADKTAPGDQAKWRDTIVYRSREMPRYPRDALGEHASGTVYVLLKVGRDGKVQDLIAQQVDLRNYGTRYQMDSARHAFAKAALEAARQWTFYPPTVGPQLNEPYWYARVPVDFMLGNISRPRYGQWSVYIPGPLQPIPLSWVDPHGELASNVDAGADGQVAMLGQGLRLKTPLNGS